MQFFLPLITRKWGESGPLYHSRSALQRFHQKLKTLKHDLQNLNRTHYGDIPIHTKKAFDDLCIYQAQVLANPCSETFHAESVESDRWHHFARIEEHLFMQKSRIQWLSLGDQNTSFYHNACRERIARNNINLLYKEDGEVLTDPDAIMREAVIISRGLCNHNLTMRNPLI